MDSERNEDVYESLSADYDRFVNWENRLAFEMPFIEEQLQLVSKGNPPIRILDAACGTGKHTLALASRGYHVSGADLSAGMIQKAINNARSAKIGVEFRQVGFGMLSRCYHDLDALLCLGNSLPHISGPSELAETLIDFGACLRPGGLLLIQNRNFDAVMAARERWMTPESYISDEGEWLFVRFYDFDQDGLITFHVITLARMNGESWQQAIDHTRLYPILMFEIVQALETVGFREIKLYGGLASIPFDQQTSGNLVISARWSPGTEFSRDIL